MYNNSVTNMIKQIKEQKLEHKEKEKKDFLYVDPDTLKQLKNFSSLYEADKEKNNNLAGLLCESRRKKKEERKKKFVLNLAGVKMSQFAEE